jgi:hypothetical protein
MIVALWTLQSARSTFGMEHDHRVIIKFLWKERADVRDIAARLQAQCTEYAYQLRTVQFWKTELRLSRQELYDKIRTGRPPHDHLDTTILAILDKSPFESTCSIGERLRVTYPTVLRYFHDSIGFKSLAILDKSRFESACSMAERLRVGHATVLEYLYASICFKSFHLLWVPHLLTEALCQKRKEHASAMLPFLYTAQRDDWHNHVTGDESWFFFNTSSRRMWTLSRDDVVTKQRLGFQSKNSCSQSYGI